MIWLEVENCFLVMELKILVQFIIQKVKLAVVISSVEGKAAYQIFLDGEIVKEEKIPADLLE